MQNNVERLIKQALGTAQTIEIDMETHYGGNTYQSAIYACEAWNKIERVTDEVERRHLETQWNMYCELLTEDFATEREY
jgi:hypothetical protein